MGIGMTPRTLGLTDLLHQYLMQVGFREPQPLKLVREQTAPLPGAHMMIAPEQAQFMALLTRLLGVRRYLEIGTYTGYSALAVALAMEADGRVVTCEIDEAESSEIFSSYPRRIQKPKNARERCYRFQ